jgi:hypothetical protein
MILEGSDGDVHPVIQREPAKQPVQLRFAVGPVETQHRGFTGRRRAFPDADDMPLFGEFGGRRRLGVLSGLQVGRWCPFRDGHLELDQKIHGLLPCKPVVG